MNRLEKILEGLNLNGVGLEIGPSHNPILPKILGYKIEVLDHAPAEALKIKYRAQGVSEENLNKIEDVDYIWQGQPLDQLTGKKDYYDYILASHVIEHVPDLITFLLQCEKMLKLEGCLSLAIPNKNFTFDSLRPPTSTGQVIQAFLDKKTHPSAGAIFDHFSLSALKNGQHTWGPTTEGSLKRVHSLEEAFDLAKRGHQQTEYLDIHNWTFSPNSFQTIINDLNSLGILSIRSRHIEDLENYEFFVQLFK